MLPPEDGSDWIAVAPEPLPVDAASAWATTRRSGALVVFLGVVRDHAEGREGVHGLTYEAYEAEAVSRLAAVAVAAQRGQSEQAGVVVVLEPSFGVVSLSQT